MRARWRNPSYNVLLARVLSGFTELDGGLICAVGPAVRDILWKNFYRQWMMTSRQKCQTSAAIDFDSPNSIEHPPPQTVRTGSLHRMLVAHPLLLLLTTEATRNIWDFRFKIVDRNKLAFGWFRNLQSTINNLKLHLLCVSVVHFPSVSSPITSVCELIHLRRFLFLATFPGLHKEQSQWCNALMLIDFCDILQSYYMSRETLFAL